MVRLRSSLQLDLMEKGQLGIASHKSCVYWVMKGKELDSSAKRKGGASWPVGVLCTDILRWKAAWRVQRTEKPLYLEHSKWEGEWPEINLKGQGELLCRTVLWILVFSLRATGNRWKSYTKEWCDHIGILKRISSYSVENSLRGNWRRWVMGQRKWEQQ